MVVNLFPDVEDTKDRHKRIKEVSEGVVSTAIDMLLVSTYFCFEFGLAGYGRGKGADDKAQKTLSEFNYKSMKQGLVNLKRKGFIQSAKEEMVLPKIAELGKKRLNSILPKYDCNRIWDGRVYLVTYDVPRKHNHNRNCLRGFLKKIGCGMLQHSVWLTPYNPKKLIGEFVENSQLNHELVVISSLGKDGTIGNKSLNELLDKVYDLSDLNDRYSEFLIEAKKSVSREEIVFSFLAILKDDPQLPFKLLPNDWLGDKAYFLFKEKTKMTDF